MAFLLTHVPDVEDELLATGGNEYAKLLQLWGAWLDGAPTWQAAMAAAAERNYAKVRSFLEERLA